MIRTIGTVLLLALAPILTAQETAAAKYLSCNSCGEEIPQIVPSGTAGDFGAWFGMPSATMVKDASPRRRAHFYSWHGGCYALDRSRQWRQVDPALC